MGLTFAISVVMFLLAGQWIDRKLGTEPLFLIVFVFVGAGASFYSIYRKLHNNATMRNDASDDAHTPVCGSLPRRRSPPCGRSGSCWFRTRWCGAR